MTYSQLAILHLATVAPCALIGAILLLRPKGTPWHRAIGRVYMTLMFFTAVQTLFMPARVGAQWLHHFGVIHLLSLVVIYNVPAALIAARRGNIAAHRGHMIGVYAGGILIAGTFALMPGRLLHDWLFP